VLGFFLPACGAAGAGGLPVPPVMDMAAIVRPASPNIALAAPAGFQPAPDLVTPAYPLPPGQLYAAVTRMAAAQPLTFPAAAYPDRLQAHFVARSAMFNFPDLIAVQVQPDSTVVLYSRSVYGYSDLGVNRRRLESWVTALNETLKPER
jgi:uncharacterized protein (DUF1499 family)